MARSPLQMYLRIYLPLMAPALVAVGVYALLLAWNEYHLPVPAAVIAAQHDGGGGDRPVLRQRRGAVELHDGDRLIYSLPPVAIYFALRRYMVAGLTMGGIKG